MFGLGRKLQRALVSAALDRIGELEYKLEELTKTMGYVWQRASVNDMPFLRPEGDADDRVIQARHYETEARRLVEEADARGRRLDALIAKLEQQLDLDAEPTPTKTKKRRMTI